MREFLEAMRERLRWR